jgi:hypothetical protein
LDTIEGLAPDELSADLLAAIFEELGMREESDAVLEELLLHGGRTVDYQLPGVHAARGEYDRAFQALEAVLPDYRGFRGAVEYDPILRRYLSQDSRWPEFLDRLGPSP